MYSIFTALYCHYLTPEGGNYNRFSFTNIDPHKDPIYVSACEADLESGKLRIRSIRKGRKLETFMSPNQFRGQDLYFQTPVVYGEELKAFFESAGEDYVYAYIDYDDEMVEFAICDFFTVNQELDSGVLDYFSDGLSIERIGSFDDAAALAFESAYMDKSRYTRCFKRRYNPLKGVTEAIFQGKVEGPQAELFQTIFPFASCRRTFVEIIKRYNFHELKSMPEKFVAVGLDDPWQ